MRGTHVVVHVTKLLHVFHRHGRVRRLRIAGRLWDPHMGRLRVRRAVDTVCSLHQDTYSGNLRHDGGHGGLTRLRGRGCRRGSGSLREHSQKEW